MRTFTFLDLFAGIGGFHIALSKLGGKCVGFSEIDKKAIAIYKQNFPQTKNLGDITELDERDVPDMDVLVGGFPCQPFSVGGKQLGMNDARGTLFFDIARIIKHKRPKLVMLENVKNLTSKRHENEWNTIIRIFHELSYHITPIPFIISPNQLPPDLGGRPQERQRVLLLAYKCPNELHENFCYNTAINDDNNKGDAVCHSSLSPQHNTTQHNTTQHN